MAESKPRYHVFLSHNSQDKGAVEPLAVMLREKGLIPFLDKWNLVPGEPIEDALIAALDNSDSAVIFVGPGGDGPWQSEEMRDILKRAVKSHNEFRAIPVLLPNASAEALEKSFLGSRLWIEFKDVDDEDALLRLANAIQGEAYGDFKLPDEPAPYRGLERFERIENPEEDFFFGRDDEIRALVERLVKDRFVAVVGASGNGKSSLIRAGLTKQLAEELHPGIRRWQTITVEPGSAPFRALAVQVAVAAGIGVADREDWIEKSVQKWRASPDGVRNSIESLFADTKEPLLLFIDQFEELFTHGKKNEESERISRNFVASLDDLWRNGGDRVRIVVAMRADFIDRCLEIGALKELLQDRTMLVGEVGDDALREIVKEPAARVGAFLEKGLMERILTDVHNQSGSLPLLEQALYELWRERRGAWLTHDAYVASGGVAGALNDQAQGAYKALDDAQKEIADNLFPRLITLGEGVADTRRRVRRSELYPEGVEPAAVNEVIDKLSGKDARILVTTREGGTEEDIGAGEDFVEFTHEALLGNWRHLADLLTSERESIRKHRVLTTATEEWASKPEYEREKFLLRAGQLVIAEQWATNEHGYARLNQLERRFLDESIQERTAEEARKAKNARNLKRRTKIAYGFAFIAFLLMLAAWYSSNEAVKARETAEINLVSGYFKAIGETGSRGELTSVTIDTLWDIALIERDALRVMFLKHALSTNKLSKRLINQIDYVAHALVGLSVDKREMLLTQALETLKEPRSAPDVKKAAAQLCVIFIGQERIEEVVQAIVSAMNTEEDADTLSALSVALGSLADRLPEKDAAAAAQAIIGTMKHEEGHNLSYLSEALGQLAKRLNEDDAAEVAEAIVAEMKTREDAFYLSYLIEALASLEEQLPEKDTAGAVKLIVAAMKTEKDARNLSRMGTALGRLGGRLTQEDAVEGTDEIVEAMKTEEDVYNLSALSDALGSLADRLPEKDAAAAAQAIIGTMKHEEGQNLEYRSKALGQLAKRLNEDDAAEVAEAIVVEMKTREDAFDLSYLIKALASLSERLPENDVAGAVELIVAAMKAEADVGKLSAMGQALASLGQRLSQEDAVAGAELIVAAMKSEDDVYKLSNLCDALESLAGRLPEKDAADSARAMLVATMRLPDGRNLSNRNEALGSLGQRLRKEEIAKLAELIVAAMKTEINVLKLSSMGVALGSLGQRLRKEDAAAGAQEVLQAMKIAKDTYDLWHLGEALGSLGGRLAEKDAIAGVEVIVAAMQTEIYAYNLRNLGEALGSLGEQLRKEDTTGIKHELVELLKNPEFDDRDRATILKALEKTTDELFHDEIWNLVTQTKELGLGDLNSPPTRPVIE